MNNIDNFNKLNIHLNDSILSYLELSDLIAASGSCKFLKEKANNRAVKLAKLIFFNLQAPIKINLDSPPVALRMLSYTRIQGRSQSSFLYQERVVGTSHQKNIAVCITAVSQRLMVRSYERKNFGIYASVTCFTQKNFSAQVVVCYEVEEDQTKILVPNLMGIPAVDVGPLDKAEPSHLAKLEQEFNIKGKRNE